MRPNFAPKSPPSCWVSASTVSWRSPAPCWLRTRPASAPSTTRSSTTVSTTSSGAESLQSTDTKRHRRQSTTWCCGSSGRRSTDSSRIGPAASRTFSSTLRACATTGAARMLSLLLLNARHAIWTIARPSKMRAFEISRRSTCSRKSTRRSSANWPAPWPTRPSPPARWPRSCANGRAACGWTVTSSCTPRSPPGRNC